MSFFFLFYAFPSVFFFFGYYNSNSSWESSFSLNASLLLRSNEITFYRLLTVHRCGGANQALETLTFKFNTN